MIHFFLQVLVLYLKENTGGYWDGSHNKSWGIRGQVNERWTSMSAARYCVKWNGEILEDNTEQMRGRWSGVQRYKKTKRKREKQKQRTGRRESENREHHGEPGWFHSGGKQWLQWWNVFNFSERLKAESEKDPSLLALCGEGRNNKERGVVKWVLLHLHWS